MTPKTILLTSFQPWLAHHRSNASDDLLARLMLTNFTQGQLIFLRQLPVEIHAASRQAIAAIAQNQPDFVICCGMAEGRDRLTVESQAIYQQQRYQTGLNLEQLTQSLPFTDISHDAGKFVCEGLYFHVLQYLSQTNAITQAIFLHVPVLTSKNQTFILQDTLKILETLCHSPS